MKRVVAVGTSLATLVLVGVTAVLFSVTYQPGIPASAIDIQNVDGESATPALSAEVRIESSSGAVARDWMRSYQESTDDFALAQDLAGAAMAGNGRAEYVLGEVLLRCELYKPILRPYSSGTLEERVEFHLANGNLSGRARTTFRQGALRCGKLLSENPFTGFELPDDASDFRYWSARAVKARDPLAVMSSIVRSAVGRQSSDDPERERAFRTALLSDVQLAVFSGDQQALFMVGGLFSHPSIVVDPEYGYAWQVAACEGGYDCSYANPSLGFGCIEDGACEAGQTLLDRMQRDFGAAKYAAIYASAQDIQYKIRTNDWDGLQQYLQIKD